MEEPSAPDDETPTPVEKDDDSIEQDTQNYKTPITQNNKSDITDTHSEELKLENELEQSVNVEDANESIKSEPY